MALTDEFTAEIEAATTASAEANQESSKGESPDGGGAFVPESGDEQKDEDDDGDRTGDPEPTGESDPDGSPSGSADPDSEGGSGKDADGGEPSGEGSQGTTPQAIMRAIEAGISAADAVALGDDKLVDQLVNQKRQAEADRLEAEELEAMRAEDAKEAEDRLKALEDSLPKLDPDETDPNVVAAFEATKKLILEQQAQLDKFRVDQTSQSTAADAAREREIATWFDGKVTALTGEFNKVLGDKGVNAVNITPEMGDAIASKIAIMVEGHRSNGLPIPKLDDLFDEASRIVLKDDFARLDEAQLADKMERRNRQDISRPGGSKGKAERSPTEEVADMLDKRYFADRS